MALTAPRTVGRSDLAEYLRGLCEALSEFVLQEHGVFLTLACEKIALESVQNWRVGLIVFELMMNARRHAFPDRGGVVRVEVVRNGGEICCLVADNGSGVHLCSVPGRGSRIVEALARELGGRVDCNVDSCGTSVYLRFPALQA
jgi:two-component sensor histidine kinase